MLHNIYVHLYESNTYIQGISRATLKQWRDALAPHYEPGSPGRQKVLEKLTARYWYEKMLAKFEPGIASNMSRFSFVSDENRAFHTHVEDVIMRENDTMAEEATRRRHLMQGQRHVGIARTHSTHAISTHYGMTSVTC